MNTRHSVTILGSGTSTGIPIPGCDCEVCHSDNPKDKRLRSSILLQIKGKNIIVDTGPDFRGQVLSQGLKRVDAVILTHTHADHLHGLDDLRCFNFTQKQSIPIFSLQMHLEHVQKMFPYIFDKRPSLGGGVPQLSLEALDEKMQNSSILEESFQFYSLPHGHTKTLGLRQGKMAYLIDCHDIPEDICQQLKEAELELLILDCVKRGSHSTHLTLERAEEFIAKISPEKCVLTHLGHDFLHHRFEDELFARYKNRVFPAHDGMRLTYSPS